MSRLARLAVTAACALPQEDLAGGSVIFGLPSGEFTSGVAFLRSYFRSPALASPLAFQNTVHNAPAAHLSIALGLRGPSETLLAGTATTWRALERALARVARGGGPVLLVVADELSPEVVDGVRHAGGRGRWGEAAAAVVLAAEGEGPRLRWHDGAAPPDAWGRAQPWMDAPAGQPAVAWDGAFGLGAGAELAALIACVRAGGRFAGPGAWVDTR